MWYTQKFFNSFESGPAHMKSPCYMTEQTSTKDVEKTLPLLETRMYSHTIIVLY